MEERTNKILEFLKEIEKFKRIERQVFISDLKRRENDAEHSWHLAMFLIVFEKDLPENLDNNKMLKMALMHDLVEIYAGDTFAFDKKGHEDKKEREEKAAQKLFSQLPDDLKDEFHELFDEFEKAETPEAKIVRSFDKIQPILQNLLSEGKPWRENNIKYKEIDDYKGKEMTHNKNIEYIYKQLLNEAKEKGWI